jgi:mono/diheme cytochrome c family protein
MVGPLLAAAVLAAGAGQQAARAAALLDLVVFEYDDAVAESGAVLSAAELADQRAIATAMVKAVRELEDPALASRAEELSTSIAAHRVPGAVVLIARKLQDDLAERFGLRFDPSSTPDAARGARLYTASCAACHGAKGRPPAEVASRLPTPPIAFADARAVSKLSARQIFSAITVGVPDEAMPEFSDALAPADRWDIAFYALSLAHAPPGKAGVNALSRARKAGLMTDLQRVSWQSDEYLRVELQAASLTARDVGLALAELRHAPIQEGQGQAATPPLLLPRAPLPSHLAEDRVVRDDQGRLLEDARVVVDVRVTPSRRGQLESLLKLLREQLLWRFGRPPFGMMASIYASDKAARAGNPSLAVCELESEDDIDCDVHVSQPLAERLRKTLGDPGARIEADDETGSAAVVVDEKGAVAPTRAQVLAAFLDRCYRLYRESPALNRLRYRARFRGHGLIDARIADRVQFDQMDYLSLRDRIAAAPPAERDRLATELYGQAIAKLPGRSVAISGRGSR